MDLQYVRLIGERREDLWTGQKDFAKIFGQAGSSLGPADHLAFIKEKRGEKIVALETETGLLVGWVGLYPDRDEAGAFFNLAGIEVHADRRGQGIGTGLMSQARDWVLARHASRLKFGTSPLLTGNATLYVTKLGTHYRWKQGVRLPDGRPWPYVSCECDFDDPLPRPFDPPEEEVATRSVVKWEGGRPVAHRGLVFSGTLTVLLPPLGNSSLARAVDTVPGFLETMYDAFERLYLHGYQFAWFDRTKASPPACYYVMKRNFAV